MRANIKYFLARLGLVAFATLGLSVSSLAHDLPDARALADAPAVATAVATSVAAPLEAVAESASLIAIARPDSGNAPRPEVYQAQPNQHIAVALPDAGEAPRPSGKAAQGIAESQLNSPARISARASEIYMPYDFQLSDWRFGQFPYHAQTASAPTPNSLPSLAQDIASLSQLALSPKLEIIPTQAPTPKLAVKLGPLSPQTVALGDFLQQLDNWQCSAYSLLTDGAALARTANRLSHSLELLALNYRQTYLPIAVPSISPAMPSPSLPAMQQSRLEVSPAVGPQFVVYDSALGGHIVLTVEQARDWQFDATAAQSGINKALVAALKPLRSSTLAAASRQLEFAGRGLLNLSQSLSNIAGGNQVETKVASLPNRKD